MISIYGDGGSLTIGFVVSEKVDGDGYHFVFERMRSYLTNIVARLDSGQVSVRDKSLYVLSNFYKVSSEDSSLACQDFQARIAEVKEFGTEDIDVPLLTWPAQDQPTPVQHL